MSYEEALASGIFPFPAAKILLRGGVGGCGGGLVQHRHILMAHDRVKLGAESRPRSVSFLKEVTIRPSETSEGARLSRAVQK